MAGAHHTYADLKARPRTRRRECRQRLVPVLLATAIASLVAALWAGLLRLGWNLPWPTDRMALAHGPLMVQGFLGTLLSLERAVALESCWAYAAPALSLFSAGAFLAGDGQMAGLAALAASIVLATVATVIVHRQPALFTWTMALGAYAWMAGNALWGLGWEIPRVVSLWMAFPFLTVVGERLELSRLRRYTRTSQSLFLAALGIFVLGLVGTVVPNLRTARLLGAGLMALTLWLMHYDIARRTVHGSGLPRYVAVSAFCGYLWLLMAGVLATSLAAWPPESTLQYDALLHSVFLGFAFSMIFAHAPIIFPALTGRSLPYSALFYFPLAALEATVLFRIAADLANGFGSWPWAGLGNVSAVLLFLFIVIGVRARWFRNLRTAPPLTRQPLAAGLGAPPLRTRAGAEPHPGCPPQGSRR